MKMKQRMLSFLLCSVVFCSAFSGITLTGAAKESTQEDDCAYEEHKHTEDCYRLETKCLYGSGQGEAASPESGKEHICTEESGCITKVLACTYEENKEGGGSSEDKDVETPEKPEEQTPGGQEPGNSGEQESGAEEGPSEEEPAAISSWEWTEEENALVWNEELGLWELGVPGASEENKVTAEALEELLPKSIRASLAEEQTEVLTLSWDFGVLPEEGVFEGSCKLNAGLPEGYVLGEEVPELSVLVELGGGETYDVVKKYVSNWSYVAQNGTEITGNAEEEYFMDSYLSAALAEDVMVRRLQAILPEKIRCEGYNTNWQLVNAGFKYAEDQPDSPGKVWGYVKIEWNVEEVVRKAFETGKKEKLTFYAVTKSNPGYEICVNSNRPDLPPDNKDTHTRSDILNLTITLYDLPLQDYITPGINPPSTTVNLFDYWVDEDRNGAEEKDDLLGKAETHKNANGDLVARTEVEHWDKGINSGRLLTFGDGNLHAGLWNKGAGAGTGYGLKYAGMTGIVERRLGADGYPVVNTEKMEETLTDYKEITDWKLSDDHREDDQLSDDMRPQNISKTVIDKWKASGNSASLDYLFRPDLPSDYRNCYEDVKGLFQIDNNGYYYYDMRKNFAELAEDKKQFILYNEKAVDRTDGQFDPDTGQFNPAKRGTGNFFPFNKGEQVFDMLDKENGKISSSENIRSNNLLTAGTYMNHHLGMTVAIDFLQPAGGRLNTGTAGNVPMTFQFSGDDDVWIFIDDVLVLDLGGIHSEIYGTIDFSNGNISIGQSWKTNGFPYKADGTVDTDALHANAILNTTLKDEYEKAGKSDDMQWSGNTFASGTSHTLKMFYLERGNYDSSLALRFNLQPLLYQQIRKVDQNGSPIEGVEFELRPAEETTASDPDGIRCFYTDAAIHQDEFYVKEAAGGAFVRLVTGADGTARFLDESGNYFNFADRGKQSYILKETKTPRGYRSLPIDIVLYYDPDTAMLSVANRWSTGAYACSVVHIIAGGRLSYGRFDPADQDIKPESSMLADPTAQEEGIAVAVPMLKQRSDGSWEALYGSNVKGFRACKLSGADGTEDVLEAALRQAEQYVYNDAPNWNLS